MVLGLSRVYHFVFSLVTSMSSKIPLHWEIILPNLLIMPNFIPPLLINTSTLFYFSSFTMYLFQLCDYKCPKNRRFQHNSAYRRIFWRHFVGSGYKTGYKNVRFEPVHFVTVICRFPSH